MNDITPPAETDRQVAESVAYLQSKGFTPSPVGLVLGTGQGQLASRLEDSQTAAYGQIPHFPQSTAMAHAGQLISGRLHGRSVAVMQGRCHLYEGYGHAQLALPIRVLHGLGVRTLIVTNAAGGIRPGFRCGDVMLLDSHINLQQPAASSRWPVAVQRAVRAAEPYCRSLLKTASAGARAAGFDAPRGVYLAVTGPSYETRAEYRAFRRLGADAVGMSTAPEVITAVGCGMRVLGLSVITNVALPDALETVSGAAVVHSAEVAAERVGHLISAVLRNHGT